MKCPHCGYTNPEDMFRCPSCRKFMDPELNLIDDIDKAIYDYEHNTPKKQVQRQNYGKYHVSTYDMKKKKKKKKKEGHPFLITIIIIIIIIIVFIFKMFIL